MECVHEDDRVRIWYTPDTAKLRVDGQIDTLTQPHLLRWLSAAVDDTGGDVAVDLVGLSFIGFSALQALVACAQRLPEGRRLLVRSRSPVIGQMLAACGWDALPQLRMTLVQEETNE